MNHESAKKNFLYINSSYEQKSTWYGPQGNSTSGTKATKGKDNDSGVILFFKVRDRVKKAVFTGKSLDDLNDLFLEKYPDFPRYNLRPFTILNQQSQIPHELDNVNDLYSNCILEIKYDAPTTVVRRGSVAGYTGRAREKTVIVMVGLPARGKTYIARKLSHMLNWLGLPTKIFNVGEYRRQRMGSMDDTSSFFDPTHQESTRALLHLALAALDDLVAFLNGGGIVGIYDAANISSERRKLISQRCTREGITKIIFLESICDDPAVIESLIRETKLSSPDYAGHAPQVVMDEILAKVAYYAKDYETIPEENNLTSYIKFFDGGRKISINKITGYIPGRIVFFLMNLHVYARPVWLTRCGEAEAQMRIGGDQDLTNAGDNYAHTLAAWLEETLPAENKDLTVWTSTMKRAIRTAQYIPYPKVQLRGLDDLDRGDLDGKTPDEIAREYPQEYAARIADKLHYRYPRGESYEDAIQRLEPVMFELERARNPILIVSHLAPLRCLYAYLMGMAQEEAIHLNIPRGTVVKLLPKAYGCEVTSYKLI
jgi:broad specificity phosphatase PhoE/shikimate kinase